MTNAQIDRAIACLSAAPRIGAGVLFDSKGPCCSLGQLVACAGGSSREAEEEHYCYADTYPELKVYGIGLEEEHNIYEVNDGVEDQGGSDVTELRRSAVIALLNSWRTP